VRAKSARADAAEEGAMTRDLRDSEMEPIAGGAFERLTAKLDRPGRLRDLGWLRGGGSGSPGGPGPGFEARGDSDGTQHLMQK
jgi:hypothetical protein